LLLGEAGELPFLFCPFVGAVLGVVATGGFCLGVNTLEPAIAGDFLGVAVFFGVAVLLLGLLAAANADPSGYSQRKDLSPKVNTSLCLRTSVPS